MRRHHLPPRMLLLAMLLSSCQAGAVPPGTAPTLADGSSDPRAAEVATALVVAGRSAEASLRVAGRLEAGAKARARRIQQADDEEEGTEDELDSSDPSDFEEDVTEEDGEDEYDPSDLADFEDDVEEVVGSAAVSELEDAEEEEWEVWLEFEVEEDDVEWEQEIEVEDDDLADLTGEFDVKDLLDAQGRLKAVQFEYTPDEKAQAGGISKHEIKAKVTPTGAEVTMTAGANDFEYVKWGSATFKLTYTKEATGDRQFTGTCQTDDGRTFDVTGIAHKDGTKDLTMNTGTMYLAFRGVKEIVDAHGYVLDRAPTDPQAQALGEVQARRNQPTTIQFWTSAVSYAGLMAAAPAPTLAKMAGLPDAGLGFAVDASAPWLSRPAIADGRQERRAVWSVRPAYRAAHAVVVTEVDHPVTSAQADVIGLVDQTAKSTLRFSLPQNLTSATLADGRTEVAIAPNLDGSYAVNGQAASDARAAARLLVKASIGQQASLAALSALDFALMTKELHATRGQIGTNVKYVGPPPRVSYRVLALGDAAREASLAPYVAVIQEAIALRAAR